MEESRYLPGLKLIERFENLIDRSGDCWIWLGGLDTSGYGVFHLFNVTQVCAHRFSYELYRGHVSYNRELHHTCRRRDCVNPNHLEVVTRKQHFAEHANDVKKPRRLRFKEFVPPKEEFIALLRSRINDHPSRSVKVWAESVGLHDSHVYLMLRGDQGPGGKTLKALGLLPEAWF